MVHTVGLLGSNGHVGGATLPYLLKAHNEEKIKIILLFRASSQPSSTLPSTVEVRLIDYDTATQEQWDTSVKGIDVFLSTIGMLGLQQQIPLVEALGRVGDAKVFVPSRFGAVWVSDPFKEWPQRQKMEGMLNGPALRAQELGLGVTKVNAGMFDEFAFVHKMGGVDVKANTIQANAAQLENPFPITTVPYLGRALADIVTRPPSEIVGKTFTCVQFWPTGNDLVEALSNVHGSPTKVIDYTAENERDLGTSGPTGPTAFAYRSAWAKGKANFGYGNEQEISGGGQVSLRDVIKQYS